MKTNNATAPAPYVPEHLDPWSEDGPTAFDSAANYCGADLTGFYVAPVAINRDTSDALTLSNWRVVTSELEPLCEHDESGIHRFGHWACGWYELFLIHASDAAALEAADGWAASLADYPAADDSDFSELEHEQEMEAWERWALSDWRDAITKRLEQLAAPPADADFYWASDVLDAVSDEKLSAFWAEVAETLSWSVQHLSDGPRFNIEDGTAAVTLSDLATLTGLPLLPFGQEWRRKPYPWPGATAAPLAP